MHINKPARSAQFTPGPWHIDGWENIVVNDQWGTTILSCPGSSTGTLAEVKANAALIAAAPAMYEALSELVKYLREEVADEALDTWAPVFKAAMALAQAEGSSHV